MMPLVEQVGFFPNVFNLLCGKGMFDLAFLCDKVFRDLSSNENKPVLRYNLNFSLFDNEMTNFDWNFFIKVENTVYLLVEDTHETSQFLLMLQDTTVLLLLQQ